MEPVEYHLDTIETTPMQKIVSHHHYHTAAGTLKISSTARGVAQTEFCSNQPPNSPEFDRSKIAFDMNGTPFQMQVWQALLAIPIGATMSYEQLADAIGKPKAYRAVANAVGQNKIAYFIPCHRVIRKDGSLGGYRWGTEIKAKLLQVERESLDETM